VPARRQVADAAVLPYEGGLVDGEDELVLEGDLPIRRESYTTAAFVP
jgi:hypothetical protein